MKQSISKYIVTTLREHYRIPREKICEGLGISQSKYNNILQGSSSLSIDNFLGLLVKAERRYQYISDIPAITDWDIEIIPETFIKDILKKFEDDFFKEENEYWK